MGHFWGCKNMLSNFFSFLHTKIMTNVSVFIAIICPFWGYPLWDGWQVVIVALFLVSWVARLSDCGRIVSNLFVKNEAAMHRLLVVLGLGLDCRLTETRRRHHCTIYNSPTIVLDLYIPDGNIQLLLFPYFGYIEDLFYQWSLGSQVQ